jgi:site-specific DNA-methyltransferase (adenine-specific)
VFLREITKRLTVGLEKQIPDLTERVNHILTKQVYGIAITELTSLLARRSVYCSKYANGIHSIARKFKSEEGNIWFERTEHTWLNGTCKYCGASKSGYSRGKDLESHAYGFIHDESVNELVESIFGGKMHFDVVIGNPPYQLSTESGGGQARPIYQRFIQQAKKLEPRYISMVTPSRWFSGGMGLDAFRAEMLSDHRLRVLVDYVVDKDAFPNVNINGGVSYFLWDRSWTGKCEVTSVASGGKHGEPHQRHLDEFDIFVRSNDAVGILRKVLQKKLESFAERVLPIDPFKLPTTFHGSEQSSQRRNVKLYGSGRVSYVARNEVGANAELIDAWKVLIPQATDGNEVYPLPIWNHAGPIVSGPGEACTFTYLIVSIARTETEAIRLSEYMKTKLFRFLVSLRKPTQHNKADTFRFVPNLPMNKKWADDELYSYFGLTRSEIEFVESTIREMVFGND